MTSLEYIYNAFNSKIVELTDDREQLEKFLIPSLKTPSVSKLFVRDSRLSLCRLLAFMIMPRAESSQAELDDFFSRFGGPVPTKSAFSMKRKTLSPDLFIYLNNEFINDFYSREGVRKWKGRYVIAVDGTTLTMPFGPRFEPLYGSAALPQDPSKRLPTARAVFLMDVLNNQILSIRLGKYGSYEPEIAYAAIMSLPQHIRENAIFIFDRLYLSSWLLTALQNNDIQYVMRCRKGFAPVIDDFYQSGKRSIDILYRPSKAAWIQKTSARFEKMGINPKDCRPLFLHLSQSKLPSGEPEVICSQIKGMAMSASQAYTFYGWRWPIETAIGLEKNEWQIEMFSGYTRQAILQDIYCKILSYNLCAMAITVADKRLQRRISRSRTEKAKKPPANKTKHRYKVNVNMALFNFKSLVAMVAADLRKLHTLLERYIQEICRYYEPYRPGDSYIRKFEKHKTNGKYVTFTNYARVI